MESAGRDERFLAIAATLRGDDPRDLETVLKELRSAGANQIELIKALCRGAGMSLKDSKTLIDRSETWSEYRAV